MFGIGKGDLTPEMNITVNGGENISDATNIVLEVLKPGSETPVQWALATVNLATGQVKRTWVTGDTDVPGLYNGIIKMTRTGSKPQTYPADGTRLQWVVWPSP